MENSEQDHLAEMDLQIDGDVRRHLYETAKWSKFISIVMFVVCGLLLLVGVLGGTALMGIFRGVSGRFGFYEDFSGAIIVLVVVIVVGLLAFVYYFLFNFSQKMKTALLSDNTAALNAGLKSLKIFFIITTIFAILSLLNSIVQLFRQY